MTFSVNKCGIFAAYNVLTLLAWKENLTFSSNFTKLWINLFSFDLIFWMFYNIAFL